MEDHEIFEQEQIKAKQKYLREEIIDKGFNAKNFTKACTAFKGPDVALYSWEDIQKMVFKFRATHSPGEPDEEDEEPIIEKLDQQVDQKEQSQEVYLQNQEQEEQEHIIEEQPKEEVFNQENLNQKQKQMIVVEQCEEIECQFAQNTELSHSENLKIYVTNAETQPGGFFYSAQAMFKVVTEPLKWTVLRKYGDFDWLHSTLATQHPGHLVIINIQMPPDIPLKNRNRFDSECLLKRAKFFEFYLNNIISVEEFRKSFYTESFLRETDEKIWSQSKKEITKNIKKPETLNQIMTPNGKLKLNYNTDNDLKAFVLNEYLYFSERLRKPLKDNIKKLKLQMIDSTNLMLTIADMWSKLEQLEHKYASIAKEYESLSNMSQCWNKMARNYTEQAEMFTSNLTSLLSFQHKYVNSYKELLKKREAANQQFTSQNQKLLAKKEKLWNSNDIYKWESTVKIDKVKAMQDKEYAFLIMLPKENATVEMLKKKLGYYNTQLQKEHERVYKLNYQKQTQIFADFSRQMVESHSNMNTLWASMLQSFSNLNTIKVN